MLSIKSRRFNAVVEIQSESQKVIDLLTEIDFLVRFQRWQDDFSKEMTLRLK